MSTKEEMLIGFSRQRKALKKERVTITKALRKQRQLHDAALRVVLTPCGPLDATQAIFRAIVGLAQALQEAGLLSDSEFKRGEAELSDQLMMVNLMLEWIEKTGCRRYVKQCKTLMRVTNHLEQARYWLEKMVYNLEGC